LLKFNLKQIELIKVKNLLYIFNFTDQWQPDGGFIYTRTGLPDSGILKKVVPLKHHLLSG